MTDESTGRPGEDHDGPDPAEPRAADGGSRTNRRQTEARIREEMRDRMIRQAGHSGAWSQTDRGGRSRGRMRWGPPDPGRGWDSSERPPWWPDQEAWPPGRRRPWRGFGCLFGVLFLAGVLGLLSIGTTVIGHVLGTPGPIGVIVRVASIAVVVAILIALARLARAIRGSGTILDALVDQAGRVEAGDYSARVDTAGPVPPPVRALARGFNTMAARLEADEAQRRSLLADVTHELRTPLAVVQGSVEAILDGIHPADEAHLSAILDVTRVLDRLIEDLRTLALSESGGLSLHREPTDLGILATEVATSFTATATSAGVTIETDIADDLPLLDLDPVRIREVIGNLVANAVRHTPDGGRVTIRARAAQGDAGDLVEIVVADTGPGIDPDLLPHVFERFARGAGSTGSGLGLSIARGLVELHGGAIEAVLPPAGGTEIRVRLPVTALRA
ncbi:MAG TPA: HAMP domain-containing sensor histidine kinase [Candidatus Limnocylindrales bacterium]